MEIFLCSHGLMPVCELISVSGNNEPLITPTKNYFASAPLLTILSPQWWGYLTMSEHFD